MNPLLAAYMAGLFEEAGWIGTRNGDPAMQIVVSREVAQKMTAGSGHGSITARGNKVAWSVQDNLGVVTVLGPMLQHMSMTKRREIEPVLHAAYGGIE